MPGTDRRRLRQAISVLNVVVMTALLVLSMAATPTLAASEHNYDWPLGLVGASAAATYDADANLARKVAANVVRSTGLDRPAGAASGHLLAFSTELSAPKGTPSLWKRLADETGSIPGGSRLGDIVESSREWLGPNPRIIHNKYGDLVMISEKNHRRIRFDINRPDPHEFPHAQIEEFINGRWVSHRIWPRDVPAR